MTSSRSARAAASRTTRTPGPRSIRHSSRTWRTSSARPPPALRQPRPPRPNRRERCARRPAFAPPLSAPKQVTWWIALVAGAAGVLEHYRLVHLPFVGHYAWAPGGGRLGAARPGDLSERSLSWRNPLRRSWGTLFRRLSIRRLSTRRLSIRRLLIFLGARFLQLRRALRAVAGGLFV